ncbi:MAG: DUF6320 domain-containing protein [Agathobacter sp.]|nr:DUF6320 domain-containing protein [Agathobacter sp.]
MSRCLRCNITVNDDTEKCPLCHQILENGGIGEDKYPDARVTTRKFRLLENIILFLSIVAVVVVFMVDYLMSGVLEWSLIVFLVLIYANVVLRLTILGRSGYIFKTVWSLVSGGVFLYLLDYMTGDRGWSLNYAFPAIIIGLDVAVLVLMIVNYRNWQSYMMMQLFTLLLSNLGMIFMGMGVITTTYLVMTAMGCSLLLFLGTLIIGDERARTELKRRFYV